MEVAEPVQAGDLGQTGVFPAILLRLREDGNLALEEIASVVRVQSRQVRNWAAGTSRPSSDSRDRLLEFEYLVSLLADVYTADGVEVWLHGRNRHLGGQRPIELLESGQFDRVRREAERLSTGVAT